MRNAADKIYKRLFCDICQGEIAMPPQNNQPSICWNVREDAPGHAKEDAFGRLVAVDPWVHCGARSCSARRQFEYDLPVLWFIPGSPNHDMLEGRDFSTCYAWEGDALDYIFDFLLTAQSSHNKWKRAVLKRRNNG